MHIGHRDTDRFKEYIGYQAALFGGALDLL